MSTIVTRSGKGSPLTHNEVDANFTNLNSDKTENSAAAITGGSINGTTIGATTPAAATFTTLGVTTSINASGAGSNVDLNINSKGTGAVNLSTSGGTQVKIVDQASVTDYLSLMGGGATQSPSVFVNGSTTNRNLIFGSAGTGGLLFYTNGPATPFTANQMRVTHTASAVNYVQVTGAATGAGNFPTISSQGSDAAVNLRLSAKGTSTLDAQVNSTTRWRINADGSVDSGISSSGGVSFKAAATSSQVNYLQSAGGPTNFEPVLSAQGSDTNISIAFQSKGTGAIDLAAGSSGVNISNGGTVTAITRTATGSGYTSIPSVALTAPTTAGGVQATVTARMYATGATVVSGGTGYTLNDVVTLSGGTPATVGATYTVSAVSGGVVTAVTPINYAIYSALPSNPVSVTGGTGAGLTLTVTWNVNDFTITNAGSGYVEQPTVSFSGGGGSGAAAYATVGSGTVVKSIGSTMSFYTPGGEAFRVVDLGATTVNYVRALGSASGGSPLVSVAGTDTNINLAMSSVGTGSVIFRTASNSVSQFYVSHTASAVNYVQVTGAATGGNPTISVQGSDTTRGLAITTKGNSNINFFNNNLGNTIFVVSGNAGTIANYFQPTASVAGVAPSLQVQGSDTNIDLALTPKGTGRVQFGTYTANMALTVQGYIEIKDAGGTVRKLAVIA